MHLFSCCFRASDHRPPPEAIRPVGGISPGRPKYDKRTRLSSTTGPARSRGEYVEKRRRRAHAHHHDKGRKRPGRMYDGGGRMQFGGDNIMGKRRSSSQEEDNSRGAFYSEDFGRASLSHGSRVRGKASIHTGGNRIVPSTLPSRTGGGLNDRALGRGLSAAAAEGGHDNNGLSRSANFMKVEKWLQESSKHEQVNIHPKQIKNLSDSLLEYPDIVEPPSERDRLRIPSHSRY